ncbi:DNA alkylation repair protein, partial [Leptospira adleri]
MAELLKDLYTKDVLQKIASSFSKEIKSVSEEEWLRRFKQKDWNQLELKQRIRRIAEVVSEELPKPFPKSLKPLLTITDTIEQRLSGKEVFLSIFLGDVVEILGIEYPEESLIAFERITKLISCEFSVRP